MYGLENFLSNFFCYSNSEAQKLQSSDIFVIESVWVCDVDVFFYFNVMCGLRILRPYVMRAGYDFCGAWSLSREELRTTKHSKETCYFVSTESTQITVTTSGVLNVMDVTTVANQITV